MTVHVFAICEAPSSSERVTGTLVALAIALGLIAIPAILLWTARGERLPIAGTYVLAAVAGAFIVSTPGGLSASDADYGLRTFIAVGAGGAGALLVSAVRRRRPLTYLATGMVGGVTFIAGLIALLIGWLSISGSCID